MDHDSFDRFARILGAAGTRRTALGALLSAGWIGAHGSVDAGDNRKQRKKRKARGKNKAKPSVPLATQAVDCLSLGQGSNVSGCQYVGEDHSGEDLSDSTMVGTNFTNATLVKTDLSSSNMRNAKFNGADLCGADLRSSGLRNADFRNADLTRADLSSSACGGVQFNTATVFCRTKTCTGTIRNDDCPNANPNEVCCTSADCANPTPVCGANNRCGVCTANAQCPNGACTCGGNPEAGQCQADFFQGFEQNTNGWSGAITRVASGTNGITSRTGGWHAEAGVGPFTRWGGYSNVFPTGGYDTELAIYLDPANGPVDAQFDYSSAINQPNCNHRRDFIFTVGKSGGNPNFCVTASNNSPGFPCNPMRDPETLTQTGWYLFRHEFRDNGSGVLKVDMKLFAPNGTLLNTWTLSDPTDVIGTTVGGNRYGWIVTNDFPFIAIDDSKRV
jgi:uncharacterized protein YjbI with pentapeptide repeats